MGKYNSLKHLSDKDTFTGEKFTEQLSTFIQTEDGRVIIQGLPLCPGCGAILVHEFLKNEWHCPSCRTVWSENSLVVALQNEKAIASLYEEV